jgi:hypothetical protein
MFASDLNYLQHSTGNCCARLLRRSNAYVAYVSPIFHNLPMILLSSLPSGFVSQANYYPHRPHCDHAATAGTHVSLVQGLHVVQHLNC